MNVPILNTQYYDMQKYEPIGYVFGMSVHAISALRGFLSNLGGIFGGKSTILNNKTRVVYEDAINDLRKNAGQCDLIIGLTVNINEIDKDFILVDATGTALRLKQKPSNKMNGGNKEKKQNKVKKN